MAVIGSSLSHWAEISFSDDFVLCTLYSTDNVLYTVQFTVYSVQCTVYSVRADFLCIYYGVVCHMALGVIAKNSRFIWFLIDTFCTVIDPTYGADADTAISPCVHNFSFPFSPLLVSFDAAALSRSFTPDHSVRSTALSDVWSLCTGGMYRCLLDTIFRRYKHNLVVD